MKEADLISRDLIEVIKRRAIRETKEAYGFDREELKRLRASNRKLKKELFKYRKQINKQKAYDKLEASILRRYKLLADRMDKTVTFKLKDMFKLPLYQWFTDEGRALKAIQKRAK